MDSSSHSSGAVPVVECARRAYDFLFVQYARFLPAALVVTGLGLAGALLSQSMILAFGFSLVVMLAQAAFAAGVFRVALGGPFVGPVGMSLGPDEFRQWAVSIIVPAILFVAFVFPAALVLGLALSRSVSGEEELRALQEDPVALRARLLESMGPVDALLLLGILVPVLWLGARLFIASSATFGERRLAITEAWTWSRGNGWRILAAIALVFVPFGIVNAVMYQVVGPAASASPGMAIFLVFLLELAATLASLPILALAAILYQGLRS